MQQSPYWEADSNSASQEIPLLLWNPNVRKSPSVDLTLRPNHPVHSFPPHFPKVNKNIYKEELLFMYLT
jgi:hypothetical protein